MKKTIDDLVKSANRLLDTVKHAVILLQMARSHLEGASLLDLNVDDEESESSEVNTLLYGCIIYFRTTWLLLDAVAKSSLYYSHASHYHFDSLVEFQLVSLYT